MLDPLIAILRNGACVLKPFLPPTHPLLSPLSSFSSTSHLPLIDLFIAPLQLFAIITLGLGGLLDLTHAYTRYTRSKIWAQGAQEMESRMYRRELVWMRERLNEEVWEAWGGVTDALLKITFGGCFYYFMMGTLQRLTEVEGEWTVLVMEIAALISLYKGLSGILKKRGQALWLLQVTADDLLYNKELSRLVDYADKRLIFTWQNKEPYHPNALLADIEHLHRAFSRLEETVDKATGTHPHTHPHTQDDAIADLHEILHRVHRAGKEDLSSTWLDALVLLLDFVAFLSYLIFPLAWFYPDENVYHYYSYEMYPGHAYVKSTGALIGDIMWTIQPFLFLGGALIRRAVEENVVGEIPKESLTFPAAAMKKKAPKRGVDAGVGVGGATTKRRASVAAPSSVVPAAKEKETTVTKRGGGGRRASTNFTTKTPSSASPLAKTREKLVSAAASIASRTRSSAKGSKRN